MKRILKIVLIIVGVILFLVVIPNCGHIPQEECPDEFMKAVMSFLDKPQPE